MSYQMEKISRILIFAFIISVISLPFIVIYYPASTTEEYYQINHKFNVLETINSTEYFELIFSLTAHKEMTQVKISHGYDIEYVNITSFQNNGYDGNEEDIISKDGKVVIIAKGNSGNDTVWSFDLNLKFKDEFDSTKTVMPADSFVHLPKIPSISISLLLVLIIICTIIFKFRHKKRIS